MQLPFRIHQSTISKILKETIPVIYEVLNQEFLKFSAYEDWLRISDEFEKLWGFPNCIGAIDGNFAKIYHELFTINNKSVTVIRNIKFIGKHCKIGPLKGFASNYWCYKGAHTFILMAISDTQYKIYLC